MCSRLSIVSEKAKGKMRDSVADNKEAKTKSTSPRADKMMTKKKKSRG